MRTPSRAADVLADLLQRLEFRDRLREYAVFDVWAEVVGEFLASKAEPIRIEDGKLFVAVASSTWMQEMQFLKDEIRGRLNARLGSAIVREIFCIQRSGRRKRPQREERRLHPVDETAIAALVPETGHPEIEEALRRVARARARRLGPGV